jgi:hypothetical protein
MLENLYHNQKKNPPQVGDERVISSKIRRAIRFKTLIILRIKGEIRPKDRKRGHLWPEVRKEKVKPSFNVRTFYYNLQLDAI